MALGHGGGREVGENLAGPERVCFPHSIRAETARGGVATVVGGDGRRWTRRRRCGLGEGTRGGRRGRGGRGGSILALTLGGDISGRRLDGGGLRPALELGVAALRGLGEG